MKKPELDYNSISENISQKCNQLLINVDVNTVSDALDAVREIVEIAIEQYSFSVSGYWKQENANADIERKIKFTDVDDGYEILLKKWVKKNPFKAELPNLPKDMSESYEEYVAKLRKNALTIGAAGTLAVGTAYAVSSSQAKGWLIFGNPIVAIAAELVGIALIYTTVQHKKNVKRQEIEKQLCELEKTQKEYKIHLVETLTISATLWLQKAESYSSEIIEKF